MEQSIFLVHSVFGVYWYKCPFSEWHASSNPT
jgi:hypothetical protein